MDESTNRELGLSFWTTLYNLKAIPRTGWLDRGIYAAEAESVADHSYLTSLIAWVVACDDEGLDADRVLQLAVIHDIAEAITGDSPPYEADEVPRDDPDALEEFFSVRRQRSPESQIAKHSAEVAAAGEIFGLMPTKAGETFRNLWKEYEEKSSPEALFVKEVDRLDAFIQSRIYAPEFPDAPLLGFTDMAVQEISHPVLAKIRDLFLDD